MPLIGAARAAINRGRVHFHALGAIAVRGLSVMAGFAVTYYVGHTMGAAANGQYAVITQTAMFLSIVAVGGMDLAVMREFAAAHAQHRPIAARSFLKAVGYSIAAALLLAALLQLGGDHLLGVLMQRSIPPNSLILLSLILLARTTTRLLSAVLRSQGRYLVGQSIEVLTIPAAVTVLLSLHLLPRLTDVLWATAIAGLASGLVAILSALKFVSRRAGAADVPMRALFKIALPLWGVGISLNLADWYGLAVAASALSLHDAGLFRVATLVGGSMSIVYLGVYSVVTPKIGVAYARGDIAALARITRSATRLSIACVAPFTVALLIFAEPILRFVGPEFETAATALRIIAVGQALIAAFGPVGLTLAMTGHERLNLGITLVGTGALLLLAPVLAHLGGLNGLAISIAGAMVGRNLAGYFLVNRLIGIDALTGRVRPVVRQPR